MTDVNNAHTISNNGLLVERENGTDGVWFGGGDNVPTHSAVIGSMYARTNGDWFKQEGPGTTDWAIFTGSGSSGGDFEDMGYNGNAKTGKFLQYHHNISSNESPLLFATTKTLKTLSIKLARNETGTITVHKNGSSAATITLTAEDEKIVTGLSVSFVSGDELSVEVTSGSIKDPVLILGF